MDLLQYLAGENIVEVSACGIRGNDPDTRYNDNITVLLKFHDGSLGNIIYTSKGNTGLGKERIEVFCDGISVEIDDFKTSRVFFKSTCKIFKSAAQDKGHREEIFQFIGAVKEGSRMPIPLESIYNSSLATLLLLDSLRTGETIKVNG